MTEPLITTLISTSGAVLVGLGGMWISTNQIGNRIADLTRRFERLEDEVRTFKEMVNGKLSALNLELAKLMDRGH
jgi:hypothetical protein